VSGLRGVTAVGGGLSTGYATSGGTVWAWGWGFFGQFGDGTLGEDSTVPVRVSGLSDAAAVVGNSHTGYALRPEGTMWAWGDSEDGQLGNGDTGYSAVPVQVPGLSEVTAIAAGGDTCYALRRDGTVWVWGSGTSGELGTGSTADAPVPAPIPGLTNVYAIAGGSETGYAVTR
jgi:alpha-tubulin suppressor-like RCC1 family protein